MDGIDSWLTALGLEQYIEVFRKEEVDLQGLTLLSELDLKDMGLPLGPRKRLLSAIASLHTADHDSSPAERRHLTIRSEENTSELPSLMRKSYADYCLKKKINSQHLFPSKLK